MLITSLTRLDKWYEENSIKDNKKKIFKALRYFNISTDNCHFSSDGYGDEIMTVLYGIDTYMVEIQELKVGKDRYECYYLISKKDSHRNGQKHNKEYKKEIKKIKHDCIFNTIKFIKNN